MELTLSETVGKTILVGITYYTSKKELVRQVQFHGTIVAADKKGIHIQQDNGDIKVIPPDLSSTKIAPAGEYRLRSTGEIVVNPALLSTWNVILHDE